MYKIVVNDVIPLEELPTCFILKDGMENNRC